VEPIWTQTSPNARTASDGNIWLCHTILRAPNVSSAMALTSLKTINNLGGVVRWIRKLIPRIEIKEDDLYPLLSSQMVNLVFFYFNFHFYFHSVLFFYFLFLEQLRLDLGEFSRRSENRWHHTTWIPHVGLMDYTWLFRIGCTVVSTDHL